MPLVLITVNGKQDGGCSYSIYSSRIKVFLVTAIFICSSSLGLFGLISSVALLLIAFCSKPIAIRNFGGTRDFQVQFNK